MLVHGNRTINLVNEYIVSGATRLGNRIEIVCFVTDFDTDPTSS